MLACREQIATNLWVKVRWQSENFVANDKDSPKFDSIFSQLPFFFFTFLRL